MKSKRWTVDDMERLAANYARFPPRMLAPLFGRDEGSIYAKAFSMGLVRIERKRFELPVSDREIDADAKRAYRMIELSFTRRVA